MAMNIHLLARSLIIERIELTSYPKQGRGHRQVVANRVANKPPNRLANKVPMGTRSSRGGGRESVFLRKVSLGTWSCAWEYLVVCMEGLRGAHERT